MACQERRVIAERQAAPEEQKFSDVKDITQYIRSEGMKLSPPHVRYGEIIVCEESRASRSSVFATLQSCFILLQGQKKLTSSLYVMFFTWNKPSVAGSRRDVHYAFEIFIRLHLFN